MGGGGGVTFCGCVWRESLSLFVNSHSLCRIVGKRDHIPLIRRSKLRVMNYYNYIYCLMYLFIYLFWVPFQIQIPKCVEPIPVQLSAISSEALAQQLTWIEHELYSRIKP